MKKLLLIALFIVFYSCNKKNKNESYFQGEALGTTYHIKVIANNNSKYVYQKDIDSVIEAVNRSLSTYRKNSLISRVNKGEILKADKQFIEVFNTANEIYNSTNGFYDPTIGILVNAWGFGPKKKIKGIEKDSILIDSLLSFVGYNMVFIDEKGIIKKKYPKIYFDFNSIAKGYAIDRVGKMLSDKDIKNYLVEIGGEVLAKGRNTIKNRAWLVGIDNPLKGKKNNFVSKIELYNQAIATSGNYRKFYVDKETGKKYVHTLNPKTGYPVISNLLSASVVAKNCTIADGYATAFMVLGLEKTKDFLIKHKELQAFLVYSDEEGNLKIFKTKGLRTVR